MQVTSPNKSTWCNASTKSPSFHPASVPVEPQRDQAAAAEIAPPESISFYPFLLPTLRSLFTRKKMLSAVDSKDQYRISTMLNKGQMLALLEKLRAQLNKLDDQQVDEHIAFLIGKLNEATDAELSIELWATMSLRLDALALLLGNRANLKLASLGYIKVIVSHLCRSARYGWAHLAHEKIIVQLTRAFEHLTTSNPIESYTRTAKGTLEFNAPLNVFSAGGSVGRQVSFAIDDEGYGKTYDSITGDLGGDAKIPFGKAGGKLQHTRGSYHYCRTPRDHAICYFNTLLDKQDAPGITHHLSRKRTLGIQDGANELVDFYEEQKKYVLTAKSSADHFSLFLSLNYSGALVETKAVLIGDRVSRFIDVPSSVLKKNQSRQHNPAITCEAAPLDGNKKKAIVVHGNLSATTGTLSGKAGFDASIYETGVTVSGEVARRVSQNVRHTTLCDLLDDECANSNPDFRIKLSRDVRETGRDIREKIHSAWYPTSKTGSNFDATTCRLLALEYQRDPDSFATSTLLRLGREPAFIRLNNDQVPAACVQNDVERLGRDLNFLENLHAQRVQGNAAMDQPIAGFYRLYGAKNVEQCLKNMAVLAAYFYGLPGIKEQKILATNIKKLEARIYATGIPHRPELLRKLAGASQTFRAITSERTLQFTLLSGFKLWFLRLAGPVLGFKINRKEVLHYNPSRSGTYYNFEITLGGEADTDRQILTALSSYLKRERATDMLELLNDEALATCSAKRTFKITYFLPHDPGAMRRVKLDRQLLQLRSFDFTPSIPVGAPGFGTISAGLHYSGATTKLLQDMPSPDTMYYFSLHYLHALFTGTTPFDRDTLQEKAGEMVQTSYWHVLVKDHRKTLEQLFGNIAQGKISDEFTQLKHRYLAYGRTPDAVNKVNAAQRSLIENAQLFHEEVSEDNYQIALEAFKAYMRTLFPHWRWTRELSAAFDAYQYEFHFMACPVNANQSSP